MENEKNKENFFKVYQSVENISYNFGAADLIYSEVFEEFFSTAEPQTDAYKNRFKDYQTKLFIVLDYIARLENEIKEARKHTHIINNIYVEEIIKNERKQQSYRA